MEHLWWSGAVTALVVHRKIKAEVIADWSLTCECGISICPLVKRVQHFDPFPSGFLSYLSNGARLLFTDWSLSNKQITFAIYSHSQPDPDTHNVPTLQLEEANKQAANSSIFHSHLADTSLTIHKLLFLWLSWSWWLQCMLHTKYLQSYNVVVIVSSHQLAFCCLQ